MRVCSFYYIKWHHLLNLLQLDNAILRLIHNGLLTLILTCVASNDSESGELCCLGSASGDGLPPWKLQNEELQSALLSESSNNCHKRSLTELSVNGGVALKT